MEKLKQEKKEEDDKQYNDALAAALQYRDRAKERRQKYGTPEPPSPPPKSSKSGYKPKEVDNSYETAASVAASHSESEIHKFI